MKAKRIREGLAARQRAFDAIKNKGEGDHRPGSLSAAHTGTAPSRTTHRKGIGKARSAARSTKAPGE